MIPVEESKEEEKTLMLSSSLEELIVDSMDIEKNSDNEGDEKKEVEEKDVSESMISIDETNK